MIQLKNLSFWEKQTFILHSDYLIIGSGIVGLSTAIYLKERKKDKKVTVLERGYLPTGASTKNAGFSCIGSPSELLDDLKTSSEDKVFSTVEKRWRGLENLNELLGKVNIGYQELGSHELFDKDSKEQYASCEQQLNYLNDQLEKITGIKKVYQLETEACSKFGFQGFDQAISHAAEGQIDTGKMMKTLLHKAFELGVTVLNGMEVQQIEDDRVLTQHGTIPFGQLAICTNGFSSQFFPDEDVAPARAQVVVTSPINKLRLKGIFHFDQGYYYFRNLGERVLFGGGRNLDPQGEETDKLEVTAQIMQQLEKVLRERIIPYADFEIEHRWAGTMGVGKHKTPIIKQASDNIFCGFRLGGMGVAIGSLVGKELAEMIVKN